MFLLDQAPQRDCDGPKVPGEANLDLSLTAGSAQMCSNFSARPPSTTIAVSDKSESGIAHDGVFPQHLIDKRGPVPFSIHTSDSVDTPTEPTTQRNTPFRLIDDVQAESYQPVDTILPPLYASESVRIAMITASDVPHPINSDYQPEGLPLTSTIVSVPGLSDPASTTSPVVPTPTFDPTMPDDYGAMMPSPSLPPGLEPNSEKVYVVIPELSAGNACTQVAKYTSQTFTFGPGELSTVQGPANITKAFNFEDLPCPPPDLAADVIWFYNPAYNPTQTYAPFLAPFPQLYNLDPAFQHCTVALNQGLDPPTPQPTAKGPTIPLPIERFGPRLGPLRRGMPPMVAHSVPSIPTATSSPESI
ncbi:MAG: hypothetical protein Q9186_007353 [Xanthomendoza sp. 1 TL-2023]